MTTTPELLDAVADCLLNQTMAGGSVYVPGDWPTYDGEYPVILVQATDEEKEPTGRATVEFTVTATIRITGRAQAPADFADGGGLVAEAAVTGLARQVEIALINNPALLNGPQGRRISQYPFVRTRIGINSEGAQHFGEMIMEMGLEFFQGPDDFYPITGAPISDVTLTTQYPTRQGPNVGFDAKISQ